MGSRRPHVKTRNACGQCKRRRVRCNLQGPVCTHCERRKELCDYTLEWGPVTAGSVVPAATKESREPFRSPTQASISAALASRETTPQLQPQPSLVLQEAFINVVRWFQSTCEPPRTMLPATYLESFEFKPQYSSDPQIFHYLIPYVTAVSSLCSLRRDHSRAPELLPSAYAANVTASRAFRGIERDVNNTNWPSILLVTLCNLMFHFAAAQFTPPADFDYLEIFQHVLRGTGGIRMQILEHLFTIGFLKKAPSAALPILAQYKPNPSAVSSNPMALPLPAPAHTPLDDAEAHAALARLAAEVRHPTDTPPATVAACAEALALLRKWAVVVDGAPRKWAHFFYWPCAVSQTFVEALTTRQPVATLIFVYWCAVMRRAPDTWFLDGWARRTAFAAMAAVAPALGEEGDYGGYYYYELLRWPMKVFNETV
ncbi:hypothetical protein F5Y09DRAFT_297982 [Xylaria sp. FL1042]|nr:hypothetical protein F5Y09DRAFT_297982 [Xylaria sp. FL1042]